MPLESSDSEESDREFAELRKMQVNDEASGLHEEHSYPLEQQNDANCASENVTNFSSSKKKQRPKRPEGARAFIAWTAYNKQIRVSCFELTILLNYQRLTLVWSAWLYLDRKC